MDSLRNSRIVVLVAALLTGIVFYIFGYEFLVSPVINSGLESLIDLTACADNYPEPFDAVACDAQINKYTMIYSSISWTLKYLSFFYLAYFCSRLIVGNRFMLGAEFLFATFAGLASIVVAFTLADTTGWKTSFYNMLPIGIGCIYFVYSNRKLHNQKLPKYSSHEHA